LIQSALQGDLELIARYGEEHPGTWAGVWFDNEPTVRIVAAFTSDVAQHDAALRPRLRHPGRLVVQKMPHSLSDLRQVRQEIERTLQQQAAETGRPILTSIGQGKAVIHVALRADQENVARELAARYGSAVELRVGAFSFPGRRRSRPRPPGRPAPEEQAFEGLEMSLEVDQRVLEVGDDGHGRLVLRNNGQERIGPLGSGQPLAGSLLNASREAVGGYSGAIAGTGLTIDLAPGQSFSIRVIYGTASTRGRHLLAQGPAALPAGTRRANSRARRTFDADHHRPPGAAAPRCQPLNPPACPDHTTTAQPAQPPLRQPENRAQRVGDLVIPQF
jgi:hypothetical protein